MADQQQQNTAQQSAAEVMQIADELRGISERLAAIEGNEGAALIKRSVDAALRYAPVPNRNEQQQR